MTATPYGGEDQPTRLQALADEAPHMDNREVARLTKKYTATNLDLYAPPAEVRVTAHCTRCGRTEHLNPTHGRDEALDILDTLGWVGLDDAPLCPSCEVAA